MTVIFGGDEVMPSQPRQENGIPFLGDSLKESRTADFLDSTYRIAGLIDVETTGLDPRRDEVIELALVLFAFRRDNFVIAGVVDEYTGRREPSIPISPGAARVNRITMDELRGECLDEAKITGLISRAEFLIAHNASFDKGFVCRLYQCAQKKPWFCSMRGINWYRTGCASRSLQNLLQKNGIRTTRAHRADGDVLATLQLIAGKDAAGRHYLEELLNSRPVAM